MKNAILIFSLLLMAGFVMAKAPAKTATIKIKTSAQCGHCEETISKALTFTKGVVAFEMNDETKVVTVTYKTKKTSPKKIREAITMVGYDADEVPANAEAYEKLSACCKKGAPACTDDKKN